MLYLVSTPIGNLKDITLRALEVLKSVDLIACEDTRRSRNLLNYYQIKKPLISFHQHSKIQRVDFLISKLEEEKDIALITDAGTPGVADPGGALIARALDSGIKITPIPGASSLTALYSVVGFRIEPSLYFGYLPKKGRKHILLGLKNILEKPYSVGVKKDSNTNKIRTLVFLESPYRFVKTLAEMLEIFPKNTQLIVGRELTKSFEEIFTGTLQEAQKKFNQEKIKGEIIFLIKNYGSK